MWGLASQHWTLNIAVLLWIEASDNRLLVLLSFLLHKAWDTSETVLQRNMLSGCQ